MFSSSTVITFNNYLMSSRRHLKHTENVPLTICKRSHGKAFPDRIFDRQTFSNILRFSFFSFGRGSYFLHRLHFCIHTGNIHIPIPPFHFHFTDKEPQQTPWEAKHPKSKHRKNSGNQEMDSTSFHQCRNFLAPLISIESIVFVRKTETEFHQPPIRAVECPRR